MSEQMRREFEEWMRDIASKHVMADTVSVDGNYVFPETRLLWQAWQASRKALVVDIPDCFDFGIYAAVYRDDVISALDASGVSYK